MIWTEYSRSYFVYLVRGFECGEKILVSYAIASIILMCLSDSDNPPPSPPANALASPHDTSAENESKTKQSSKEIKPFLCREIVVWINNTQILSEPTHALHIVWNGFCLTVSSKVSASRLTLAA